MNRKAHATVALTALALLTACSGDGESGSPSVRPPGGLAPYTTPAEPEEQVASQPLEPTQQILTTTPPRLGSAPALAPATQSPPPAPGNLAPCKTAQLGVRVIRQLGKSKNGPGAGLAVFTNTGNRACALSGWPTVGLTKAGTPLGVPATKVNKPRQPVGMALQPDRTAFAGMQWRGCPPTATGCRSADGFRVGAPGSNAIQADMSGFTASEQKGFGVSALVVGSLQPTTTDIVNW